MKNGRASATASNNPMKPTSMNAARFIECSSEKCTPGKLGSRVHGQTRNSTGRACGRIRLQRSRESPRETRPDVGQAPLFLIQHAPDAAFLAVTDIHRAIGPL